MRQRTRVAQGRHTSLVVAEFGEDLGFVFADRGRQAGRWQGLVAEVRREREHVRAVLGVGEDLEAGLELWVIDDAKYAEARGVLRSVLAPIEGVKKPWKCSACGEDVEGQFAECWNCGKARP